MGGPEQAYYATAGPLERAAVRFSGLPDRHRDGTACDHHVTSERRRAVGVEHFANETGHITRLRTQLLTGQSPTPLQLLTAWTRSGHPELLMPQERWIDLFNNAHMPVPDHLVTVYRGAHTDEWTYQRFSMSWTTSRQAAVIFARQRHEDRTVLEATAPVGAILADCEAVYRQARGQGLRVATAEPEMICDPLLITDVRQVPERQQTDRMGLDTFINRRRLL